MCAGYTQAQVAVLDLSNLNLTKIPEYVFQTKDITKLNLRGNNITSLPKEIGELKNLK